MVLKIIIALVVFSWVIFNQVVAMTMSAKEMKEDFIDGQCVVGKICANIFYSVAWLLKGLKWFFIKVIK